MSIDLEALRMLGSSTLAPDAALTAAAERALFERPSSLPGPTRRPGAGHVAAFRCWQLR